MLSKETAYYAIIPANVRYDQSLTDGAKLLYGEITALCNQKGFCYASNSYFAELYGKTKGTISVWINQLIKGQYIYSRLVYEDGKKSIQSRHIFLAHPITKNRYTPNEKSLDPITKNRKDNNTVEKNALYRALEFLKSKENSHWLEITQKNSGLPAAEFSKALEKFDLDRIEKDIEYNSINQARAGFQKYLMSWSENYRNAQTKINSNRNRDRRAVSIARKKEFSDFGEL